MYVVWCQSVADDCSNYLILFFASWQKYHSKILNNSILEVVVFEAATNSGDLEMQTNYCWLTLGSVELEQMNLRSLSFDQEPESQTSCSKLVQTVGTETQDLTWSNHWICIKWWQSFGKFEVLLLLSKMKLTINIFNYQLAFFYIMSCNASLNRYLIKLCENDSIFIKGLQLMYLYGNEMWNNKKSVPVALC